MSTATEKHWFAAVAALETCVLCGRYGVQVSHCNVERGMGQKAPYYMTAALCPECHQWIDNGKDLTQMERRYWWYTAWARTTARLIAAGKLKLAA